MCEGFDMVIPIFFAVQVWYQMTASATTCNWVSERIGWFLNHLVPRFCSICQKYSRSLVAKCFLLPTCNLITKNIHCCFQKTFPIMRCSSPSRMNESTISWGRRTCWVRSRWHPFCKERVESKFSSMKGTSMNQNQKSKKHHCIYHTSNRMSTVEGHTLGTLNSNGKGSFLPWLTSSWN